jgi:hypothetical protein
MTIEKIPVYKGKEYKNWAYLTVEVGITQKDLFNLIVSAIEGGSNYWCEIISYWPETGKPTYEDDKYSYADAIFQFNGNLVLRDLEEQKDHVLNLDKINKGLHVLAQKYPYHLGNILKEDADAITADVFLQACLFGKIIYS